MKKLISIVIALAMILSLSVAAFAVDISEDTEEIEIAVSYVANSGTSPEIEFGLTIGAGEATECTAGTTAPGIDPVDPVILGADGEEEGKLVIALPDYDVVGKYTYPVTITTDPENAAGVTYFDASDVSLVVWVVNNPDYTPDVEDSLKYFRYAYLTGTVDGEEKKIDELEYSYDAGDLEISKEVAGNLGDKTLDFTFTVTLTAPEGTVFDENNEYPATITLKHGESVTIENIPVGTTWKVAETENEDYETTVNGEDGLSAEGEIATGTNTCAFVNTRNAEIETGVILESLPYVVNGLVVVAAVDFMIVRKNRKVED